MNRKYVPVPSKLNKQNGAGVMGTNNTKGSRVNKCDRSLGTANSFGLNKKKSTRAEETSGLFEPNA